MVDCDFSSAVCIVHCLKYQVLQLMHIDVEEGIASSMAALISANKLAEFLELRSRCGLGREGLGRVMHFQKRYVGCAR